MASIDHFATYREIKTQDEAWVQALERIQAAKLPGAADYDQVLFTGCGSTYYLSLAAAALYQELTGQAARAVPGSELLLNAQTVLASLQPGRKALLVAVSRSGTTTETVRAVQKFKRDRRGDVIVISNYNEVLSRQADVRIEIPAGQEQSVAQTRSFASMYVAAAGFAARMAGRDDLLAGMALLPQIGRRLMADFEPQARRIGENLEFDRFYFLGSGIRYGLACEVNLKMKEMTLTHSEPFHFLEFRHGPMSMVLPSAVLVGLVSEKNFAHEMAVLFEMQVKGGTLLTLGENKTMVAFDSGLPESVRAVLYLPVLQLMAFYRSMAKGLNPDSPNNLTSVVKLEL
jgi:glutamine---fructose-6-phosphate transaminase (isomerizing)